MLRQRTLIVLAVLCLATSLVARELDQHLIEAHATVATAGAATQDPGLPAAKLWANYNHISRNPILIDTVSIVSLVLGVSFALAALWKHLK
ncbi:hypothetical protein [Novosphingobium rosa]|uniref:hypothetical protein n=1 Tax=Novosphingobium rosa TaxID=76978 RepID=UPI0008318A68|nr:hypothetical protein [Novosphingobium rosa]